MQKTFLIAGLALAGFVGCSGSSGAGSTSGTNTAATTGGDTGGTGATSGGSPTTGTSTGAAMFLDMRDHQIYPEVVIGNQTWLAANMNYETPSGSSCYDSDSSNCATYGRVYTFAAAAKACPEGSHLASDAEWMTLETTLGMASNQLDINGENTKRGTNEGTALKEGGRSGFEAKLSGYQTGTAFYLLGTDGYFWTSTEGSSLVWRRHVASSSPYLYRFNNPVGTFAISVRCLMGAASP